MKRMTEKETWEAASAAIRATGARNTTARTRVLAVLLDAEEALTEPQIEDRLAGPALDCVTIYRVLEWLVAVHLVHRIPGSDGIWRFMTIERGEPPRGMFECIDCARLVPLPQAPDVDTEIPPGFVKRNSLVHIFGTCQQCAEAATRNVAANDAALAQNTGTAA